MGNAAKILTC